MFKKSYLNRDESGNSMRVLVVNTVPYVLNGISSMIMNYYQVLKKDISFDFVINAYIDAGIESKIDDSSEVYILPNRKKKTLQYIKELRKIAEGKYYDVIHIHGNSALMSIELFAVKNCKNTVIITHNHNTKSEYPLLDKLLRSYFQNNVSYAFAASRESGAWLYGNYPFKVIENGLDMDSLQYSTDSRKEIRRKYQIGDETLLLNIGRYNFQKNKKFVIDSFREYLQFDASAKLMMIGEGSGRKEIEEYVKELRMNQSVIFVYKTNNIEKYYSAADIFTFPTKWEALGMVIVEAQVAGLPSLIGNTVPMVTEVSDRSFYFDISDEKKWAQKLYQIKKMKIDHESQYDVRMDQFNIKNNAQELKKIYEQMCLEKVKANSKQ